MFDFLKAEKDLRPKVWNDICNIWDIFEKEPADFREWEPNENLEGLTKGSFSGLQLSGLENWVTLPPEIQAQLLFAFIAGVRVGNKLNREES